MTQLVWLSDLHLSATECLFGTDTKAKLSDALVQIEKNAPNAAWCVISGDLVNRGIEEDYAALAELLDGFGLSVFPMVGNHDARQLLRRHLTLPTSTMDDFIQYSVAFEDCAILCLDTQEEGADHGRL